MAIELMIKNSTKTVAYIPAIEDGLEWTTERSGTPGKATFKVIQDAALSMSEGDEVSIKEDGTNIFFGYIFKQSRDRDGIVTVTAYDQLRYLKNKDTYVYSGKTATQFIQMIATDFNLQLGTLEDTKYVIPSRTEENTSLFDMIGNALDLTIQNNKEMFVLYDDFGKLTLKSLANMKVGSGNSYLMLSKSTGENFTYSSSIDDQTYNKIKLTYDNDSTGKREVYIAQHDENMNSWGTLQYFDKLSKGENGQAKADALLQLYNQKTRKLKLTKQFGDSRVRAGSLVVVCLDLGDTTLKNFMLVEKCKHTWNNGEHWMELTLRGGEFSA